MGKLPAIQLYPGDWLRDDVAACSLAAQGLWLRMMFVMHDSARYGYLSKNGAPIPPATVALRCGTPLEQYTTLLDELDRHGVPSRTDSGTIYSRRMVRDAKARALGRKNGCKGGSPLLLSSQQGVNPPPYPPPEGKGKMNVSPGGEGAGRGTNGETRDERRAREIRERSARLAQIMSEKRQ